MSPFMIGLSGSAVFWGDGECGFSTVGVGVIPGNECGIQNLIYIALLQGSRVTAGFHYKD